MKRFNFIKWFFYAWTLLLTWGLISGNYINEEELSGINTDTTEIKSVPLSVTCTVYNPTPAQCNSNPLITADGSKISLQKLEKGEIRWIAVSRDLLASGNFKYGDRVRLTFPEENHVLNGIWEIHDTMHKRWIKRIDILQPCGKKGILGKWQGVTIEKI